MICKYKKKQQDDFDFDKESNFRVNLQTLIDKDGKQSKK